MKCPHCLESFVEKSPDGASLWCNISLGRDVSGVCGVGSINCPACRQLIIKLFRYGIYPWGTVEKDTRLVYPKSTARPLPAEVPNEYTTDFKEACNVLPDSPKASAALSRRCLQRLLREKAGVGHSNLADEIEQVINSGKLPSYLSDAIDGVRNIGNFAAHPIKSTNTGEIIDVETGEAEWLLDTLESLFDFYFVQPEKLKQKRNALNKKLQEAGKPPMK